MSPAGFEALLQVLTDPEAAGITPELEPIAPTPPRLGDILVAEGKVDRQDVETVAADCGALPRCGALTCWYCLTPGCGPRSPRPTAPAGWRGDNGVIGARAY